MIQVIAGTNRPASRSREIANIIDGLLKGLEQTSEVLDLAEVDFSVLDGSQYGDKAPENISAAIKRVNDSDGIIVVCPEYNGSYPGILKYFIDHWSYPVSFENRPVAFVGLGGRFGGMRPVEHLQGVFGYRNAYVFPERVFLTNIWSVLKDGRLQDELMQELLEKQVEGFVRFIAALKSEKLDAQSKKLPLI